MVLLCIIRMVMRIPHQYKNIFSVFPYLTDEKDF